MNLQKFIDILDQKADTALDFFKKHGKNVFKTEDFLLKLLDSKWREKKWFGFIRLSWIIEFRDEIYGNNIDIRPIYRYFADYMNSACSFFGDKRIPFEEWEDLAKEQVGLLHTLIKENKLEGFKTDPRYYAFFDKYDQKEEELFKKGYTQLRDNEYR